MTPPANGLWAYLATSPLLGLTLTLVAYQCAHWLFRRSGSHPAANPVLLAMLMLMAFMFATDTPYATYFEGAQFVHFLLGPATVALAIPLYGQIKRLRAMALPLALTLLAGSSAAIVSAVLIARVLGASVATQLSFAPKSVTTPIAMGISEQLGGIPSLTAVLVIVTGVVGAIGGHALYRLLNVRDEAVRGFALGLSSHGVGTARAFQESEATGAFSALAMGLNGILTALLAPVLVKLMF